LECESVDDGIIKCGQSDSEGGAAGMIAADH
jgi:hypothetical protein